jgi:hypothetical protein
MMRTNRVLKTLIMLVINLTRTQSFSEETFSQNQQQEQSWAKYKIDILSDCMEHLWSKPC